MKPKHIKLTILSRGPGLYSTMRLAFEAREIGWRVRVVNPLTVTLHMAPRPVCFVNQKIHEPNAVLARIGNSITHQGVSVVRHLSFTGIPVLNQPDAILRSRNKLEAHQTLVSSGLDMPATVYVAGQFYMEELVQTLGPPPWVIKVVAGTQGVGVLLAKTTREAESLLEFAAAGKQPVLVQKFIAEAKGADIRAFVVGNEVVAAMKRQAPVGEFRSNLHRGGSAKRYRMSNLEKAVAVRAAKALGLEIAGVDMLLSNQGPLLMEVNSSPGIEGIENSTGVNVASSVIHYLHGQLKDCWANQLLASKPAQQQTTPPTYYLQPPLQQPQPQLQQQQTQQANLATAGTSITTVATENTLAESNLPALLPGQQDTQIKKARLVRKGTLSYIVNGVEYKGSYQWDRDSKKYVGRIQLDPKYLVTFVAKTESSVQGEFESAVNDFIAAMPALPKTRKKKKVSLPTVTESVLEIKSTEVVSADSPGVTATVTETTVTTETTQKEVSA